MTSNGNHQTNGVNGSSQTPHINGDVLNDTGSTLAKAVDSKSRSVNGTVTAGKYDMASTGDFAIDMAKLPDEILAMLGQLPDDLYVELGTLIRRATSQCWADILKAVETLSAAEDKTPLRPLSELNRFIPSTTVKNDTSPANRSKKDILWDVMLQCRHVLTKLHVLMQWASRREENKLTIALNLYIHALRNAYVMANGSMSHWITYLASRQDSAPDIEAALETLATGRISGLPDLGYVPAKDLTPRQMLATLRQLNATLQLRMTAEENLPTPFHTWRIHDGRITFHVTQEFDLSVSVLSEDPSAVFQTVDLKFSFSPRPVVSDEMLDSIITIVNNQLSRKGLTGAFTFIHDFVLTQKVKELQAQAIELQTGLWAGHLHVEMLRRNLVLQYWTRRNAQKSWIEIVINSGRSHASGIPYIQFRWMRNGKLVPDHDIEVDLSSLSCEKILQQVVAQHTAFLLTAMYEKLVQTPLYVNHELSVEEETSLDHADSCHLTLEVSKREVLDVTCDSISGAVVLSPPTERSYRMQLELSRSANVVDDFARRIQTLRCSINLASLIKAVDNTAWISLPGRKLPSNVAREVFKQPIIRSHFFRQDGWAADYSVAATFSIAGDAWWLVHDVPNGSPTADRIDIQAIHLQDALSTEYFERLSTNAEHRIVSQVVQQGVKNANMEYELSTSPSTKAPVIKLTLSAKQQMSSLSPKVLITPKYSQRRASRGTILILAKLNANKQLLERLATTGMDSSITLDTKSRTMSLELDTTLGHGLMSTILARLRYVNDLLSCIKLVNRSGSLRLSQINLDSITIDYRAQNDSNLGVELLFNPERGQSKVKLLPESGNPQELIGDRLEAILADEMIPLSIRLHNLTADLTMTLPLIEALQFLQGSPSVQQISQMKDIDVDDLRKSLRFKILVRDTIRFGVHIFSTNPSFHKDIPDTPSDLLVRLEIEPTDGKAGTSTWLIRPAIEEYSSYKRPSFSSSLLRQRLKERVFALRPGRNWVGLDNAVVCTMHEPYELLADITNTIMIWLKEALAAKPVPPARAAPQPQAQQQRQNQQVPNQGQNAQVAQLHAQQQAALQRQQQAMSNPQFRAAQQQLYQQRAAAMQMARSNQQGMQMTPQMQQMLLQQQQQQQQGSARVMTAMPQQMRQPQQNPNQRRPMPPGQRPHGRGMPGPQHDVINID